MSRRLIAHLAHLEITTPKPEESLQFFTEVLGLEETTREGQSVYLRGWGGWCHRSLQRTEGDQPGLDHTPGGPWSAEDLEKPVASVDARGAGAGWIDESVGHGPAYRFTSP